MDELPPILGQTDIVTRWGYTRQGLDQIMKREADFPAPIAAINGGRNRYLANERYRNVRGQPSRAETLARRQGKARAVPLVWCGPAAQKTVGVTIVCAAQPIPGGLSLCVEAAVRFPREDEAGRMALSRQGRSVACSGAGA